MAGSRNKGLLYIEVADDINEIMMMQLLLKQSWAEDAAVTEHQRKIS